MVSNTATQPAPAPDNPMVRHASIVRSIAETLAGGPRVKTTINADGSTTRESVPLSRKDIGMAIALSALQGSLAGLSAKGPNANAQAAGLGFNQVSKQRTEADQEQEAQAQADFARKAQTADTNFRLHSAAVTNGRLDREANEQYVNQYADIYKQLQETNPQAIKAVVPSGELQKYAKQVHQVTAIPVGVVPRIDSNGAQITNSYGEPQWDVDYAVVDPSVTAELDQQTMGNGVKQGQAGFVNSNGDPVNIAQNTALKLGTILNMKSQQTAVNTAEAAINSDLKRAGVDPLDFASKVGNDRQLASALRIFGGRYAGQPLDQALSAMATSKNDSDKQAAGYLRNFLGDDGQKAVQQLASDRAAQQSKIEAQKRHDEAVASGEYGKNVVETKKAQQDLAQAASTATSDTAFQNDWQDPKSGKHYDLSNPILNMVEGNQDPSQLTKRGKNYDANLKLANDYSFARYGRTFDPAQAATDFKYANQKSTQDTLKLVQSLTGEGGLNNTGTLKQLQDQFNALGNTRIPKINDLKNWASQNTGSPAVTNFASTLLGVSDEMGKILGGGVATDSSRQEAQEILDKAFSQQQGKGAIHSIRSAMANRYNSLVGNNRYLAKQFGKIVNPANRPTGATMTVKDKAGNLHWSDGKQDLGLVQ